MAAVKSSDIVVLIDKTIKRAANPFDTAVIEYWDSLEDFTEGNLKVLASGIVDGVPYRIFVRPVSGQLGSGNVERLLPQMIGPGAKTVGGLFRRAAEL